METSPSSVPLFAVPLQDAVGKSAKFYLCLDECIGSDFFSQWKHMFHLSFTPHKPHQLPFRNNLGKWRLDSRINLVISDTGVVVDLYGLAYDRYCFW